jgi:hypothetical protein
MIRVVNIVSTSGWSALYFRPRAFGVILTRFFAQVLRNFFSGFSNAATSCPHLLIK